VNELLSKSLLYSLLNRIKVLNISAPHSRLMSSSLIARHQREALR
jgi:hypothetical protein